MGNSHLQGNRKPVDALAKRVTSKRKRLINPSIGPEAQKRAELALARAAGKRKRIIRFGIE